MTFLLPPGIKGLKANKALEKTFSIETIIAFRKNKSLKQFIEGNSKVIKNIEKSNNKYEEKCTHCKSEYDHCAFYRYKTHINFLANKMDGYLQFSTKSTAKAILLSIF